MNKTFTKAIHHLSQPLSLLAILLLFLNDHVLRVLWPSWITGKLGDFAWLFFAPFALAAVLALLIPQSVHKHEKLVGLLAFGIVGAVFFLGNSFAVTHEFVLTFLVELLPFPVQIIRDHTDLIALFAMVPAWRMWQDEAPQLVIDRSRSAVLLSVAACLTIATSPPIENYGINCLYVEENRIIAVSNSRSFASQDGGMSWDLMQEDAIFEDCWEVARDENGIVADPDDENTLFRMNSRKRFEVSEDQSQTWQEVPGLRMSSDAAMAFINKGSAGSLIYEPGPFQVVRDPQTGNLIFSMGQDGVVVMTSGGHWEAVTVGEYGVKKYSFEEMLNLLIGEFLLAFEVFLLVFIMLYQIKVHSFYEAIPVFFLWVVWGFVTWMRPAWNYSFGLLIQRTGLAFVGVIGLYAMLTCHARLREKYTGGLRVALLRISAICGGVFLLPYVLWGFDIIHQYETAMIAGLVLGGLAIIAGIVWMLKIPIELKEPVEDVPAPEEPVAVEEIEDTNED
jgi:hypothetical protein